MPQIRERKQNTGIGAMFKSYIVNRKGIDWLLVTLVIILVGIGLATIYSASSYDAILHQNGDDMFFLKKQLQATVFGIILMVLASRFQYDIWMKRQIIFVVLIVALAAMLLLKSPLAVTINNATRWIKVPIFGTFQPAEIVKIATILYCSTFALKLGKKINTLYGMALYFIVPGIYAALIYFLSKNLSSAIIVAGIAVVIAFVASSNYSKYIAAIVLVVVGVTIYILTIVKSEKGEYPVLFGIPFNRILSGQSDAGNGDTITDNTVIVRENAPAAATGDDNGFRQGRIIAWLYPEDDPQGTSFQTNQGLYAIGSGGIMGKGYGQSLQKLGFLPEAQNDMIFAVFCEEWGFAGACILIFLFLALVAKGNGIAARAPDLFGSLLTTGVIGQIAIQVLLNVAVVTNTIPNTGISLPFISYGGTSSALLLAEIGIVLNVSKGGRISRDAS